MAAAKRVLQYVKGTREFELVLGAELDRPMVELWSDADWAGDLETRQSTMGSLIFFYGSPITWTTKRLRSITRSAHESEYIGLSLVCARFEWLKQLLEQMGLTVPTVPVWCDNQRAIATVTGGGIHSKTRHVDVSYKTARDLHVNVWPSPATVVLEREVKQRLKDVRTPIMILRTEERNKDREPLCTC